MKNLGNKLLLNTRCSVQDKKQSCGDNTGASNPSEHGQDTAGPGKTGPWCSSQASPGSFVYIPEFGGLKLKTSSQ